MLVIESIQKCEWYHLVSGRIAEPPKPDPYSKLKNEPFSGNHLTLRLADAIVEAHEWELLILVASSFSDDIARFYYTALAYQG
jgi:hypothetical protein